MQKHYTWEEKIESLVKLAKRVDTFFSSREGTESLDKIPGLFLVRLASDEVDIKELLKKHDGKLGGPMALNSAEVGLYPSDDIIMGDVHIHGGYGEENRGIHLDAKQALSLLAWLRQEEATLEELAKG